MTILVSGVAEPRQTALAAKLEQRVGARPLRVHVGNSGPEPTTPFAFSSELSDAEVVERVARQLVRDGVKRGSLRAQAEDATAPLTQAVIDQLLDDLVAGLGSPKRVLLLPPDATRAHSGAGALSVALFERL